MAQKLWVSSDGNWGSANSWSPTGVPDGTKSGVPYSDVDDILFSVEAGGTNHDVVTGLDQSGLDGYGTINVDQSYTGNWGSSGGGLQASCKFLIWRGGGVCYFEDAGGDGTQIVVCDTNARTAGSMFLSGAAIDRIYVNGGGVRITDAGTLTLSELHIDPNLIRGSLASARAEISGSLGSYDMFISGGIFDNSLASAGAVPNHVEMSGGENVVAAAGTIGGDFKMTGGRWNLGRNAGAVADGDNVSITGGEFDYSLLQATNPSMASSVFVGPNAIIRRRGDQGDFVSTGGYVLNQGRTRVA